MKLFNKFFAVALGGLLVLSSCETAELDLTSNPNALSPSQADADFFLNALQEDFALWTHNMGNIGAQLTRVSYMSGRTYNNVYSPASLADEWEEAYQDMLQDIKLMNALSENKPYHRGMGKVFQAYIMITLVDYFGNVPDPVSGTALKGDAEGEVDLNPVAAEGSVVYDNAIQLLQDAKNDFAAATSGPALDFYYNGDASKWIKAANSILKKIYWTTGNNGAYNGITDYIQDPADDFRFPWGTNQVQPDTRHPFYRSNYTATGGQEYMPHYLIWTMQTGHGSVSDPRLKYYYYRQVDATPGFGADPDEEVLECSLPNFFNPYGDEWPHCGLPDGYWGRDHGNDNGIPPDGFLRTLRGVYPAGGRFDDDSFEATALGGGRGGDGITPIMTSSWMHFMNAHVAVQSGNVGEAYNQTRAGVEDALAKVQTLGPALDERDSSSYLNGLESDWNAASTAGKLDIWAKQFLISSVGNGNDAYIMYRKTGLPSNIQPNIEDGAAGTRNAGDFPTLMFYPSNYVSNNSNAQQRSSLTDRPFWMEGVSVDLK